MKKLSLDEASKKRRVGPPRVVGFAYDNFMLLHENHKRGHPERPSRLMSIYTHFEKNTKLLERCVQVKCPFADIKDIQSVHPASFIE
jgi:acetoin utilization deacetylase AcuC-like enzyme